MSYSKKIEYEIVPEESFSVIRNCSGCGKKTSFKNTKKFRVNANGNKLDVWLIYQCEKCRHTWNLAIYERQKISVLPAEEYQRFLQNDQELAQQYGRNIRLFQKNKGRCDSYESHRPENFSKSLMEYKNRFRIFCSFVSINFTTKTAKTQDWQSSCSNAIINPTYCENGKFREGCSFGRKLDDFIAAEESVGKSD